ncbi:hypothetical protein J7F03_39350 [Streptomyces sp. ISL-43]|uniref:hypothetical protein n=1 Tax=Streptomyces sp. ISL-43 TaxID=2819183 RepID=UPI001BE66BC5|nr:hypothetical protein [Streptomyces sp. ISL-43]MBT2452983.1 hypothetical protein [Streptomyces sp. ISL-43]
MAIDLLLALITALAGLSSAVAGIAGGLKQTEAWKGLRWLWQRKRLTLRSVIALLGIGVAIYVAFSNLLIAGLLITSTEIVRLLNPRGSGQAWKPKDLNLHIASEVFFHCLALVGVALGLTCMALGAFKELELGPRVTISLTLGITAIVAVNKSTARTRKLCTEISKRTSTVVRSFAELHEVYDQDKGDSRLADLRRKCLDDVDGLTRALATRLNTGYRIFGTPILPPSDFRRLIAEARVAAKLGDEAAAPWRTSAPKLQQIRRACGRWTDEMA